MMMPSDPSSISDKDDAVPRAQVPPIRLCDFQEALERYVDESKPDLLAKKQVQAYTLEWRQDTTDTDANKNNENKVQSGSLNIHGQYIIITLDSYCTWTLPDSGTLDFSLRARAKFAPPLEMTNKTNRKVQTEMKRRLRQDDYIKPLLESKEGLVVCEAFIHLQQPDKLEERVRVDENVAEGIRRCIYSQSQGCLSLMELLVSLPYLPSHTLGQRAKLRLLEDAMVDACEQEEENELLDELSLTPNTGDEQTSPQSPKRTRHV